MDAKQEVKTIEGVVDGEAIDAAEEAQASVAQVPTLISSASDSSAPDAYAVGIQVMRMAPVWLLTTSISFVLLIILLSWIRPDASASGRAFHAPNDSKAPASSPSALPAAHVVPNEERLEAEAAPVAEGVDDKAASSETPTPSEPASPTSTSPAESHPAVANPEESSLAGAPENGANSAGASEQKFTVQVSSHSNESGANEQVSRLRAAGFDARTIVAELPGRGKWYRVQSGSFDDRAGAAKGAALLRAKGVAPSCIVVPL